MSSKLLLPSRAILFLILIPYIFTASSMIAETNRIRDSIDNKEGNGYNINLSENNFDARDITYPDTPDPISVNYSFYLDYKLNGKEYTDDFELNLIIQGNRGLYENGTIKYYLDKNITQHDLIDRISGVFEPALLNYFLNHTGNEYIQTCFSYRIETAECNPEDPQNVFNNPEIFTKNAVYTIFWLNTTKNTENDFKPYGVFKFYSVENPYSLFISPLNPDIAEGTWSSDPSDLRKNVRILRPYYLKQEINDQIVVRLYYERKTTILLRLFADISSDDGSERLIIDIKLKETSFPIEFLPNNPYWEEFKKRIIIYSAISGIIAVIIIGYVLHKRGKIKEASRITNVNGHGSAKDSEQRRRKRKDAGKDILDRL